MLWLNWQVCPTKQVECMFVSFFTVKQFGNLKHLTGRCADPCWLPWETPFLRQQSASWVPLAPWCRPSSSKHDCTVSLFSASTRLSNKRHLLSAEAVLLGSRSEPPPPLPQTTWSRALYLSVLANPFLCGGGDTKHMLFTLEEHEAVWGVSLRRCHFVTPVDLLLCNELRKCLRWFSGGFNESGLLGQVSVFFILRQHGP